MAIGSIKIEMPKNISAKLKVIAKHTGALADELDRIDADTCPECGAMCDKAELFAEGRVQYKRHDCAECGNARYAAYTKSRDDV